jgi:ferredoxin-thioredoxin reductase catalytic subunit
MPVKLNDDKEIVATIREGLKKTGGYCPCRRERTEDFKCMCREFREQIADPNFEGFCHCMLYYKYNEPKKS